ncbi:MAG TPA: MerR family transcriptional regulator [Bacteroidota bacterium]|mgnify:CR=1 FL=1|nr:MerR family transcriptional regulator [Bacteroidota bacterium]HRT67918.1 MerR family transcriptional regulator [Bacteroidota bacterium]
MKKLYYSIGEVSKLLNEEQYTLRYWEKEFPIIKPHKNRGGNRVYSPLDFELLSLIHILLREKKYNIKKINEIFASFNSKNDIIKEKDKILSSITPIKPTSIYKMNPPTKMQTLQNARALEIINEILDILEE